MAHKMHNINAIEIVQKKDVYTGSLVLSEWSSEMRHIVHQDQISYLKFPDPVVPISCFYL